MCDVAMSAQESRMETERARLSQLRLRLDGEKENIRGQVSRHNLQFAEAERRIQR